MKTPRICLIGHSDYSLKIRSKDLTLPFGEVNNAKKLQRVLKEVKIPVTEVLDIYELFEIEDMNDERGTLFQEMLSTNISLATSGIDFITDFQNSLSKTFRKNIQRKLSDHKKNVIFFLTWAGKGLSMLSTGIQNDYPIIGKEDSFIKASNLLEPFPMEKYAREVQVLTSESLLGAVNCNLYGIPLDKFMYLPNLAPSECEALGKRTIQEKREFKVEYIKKLAQVNQKKVLFDSDTFIIGCPTRLVRRKNVDMLIFALAEVHKRHPNILFVLKGDMDSEFDIFSLYSEKLYQLLLSAQEEPWFLWDRSLTPYPEVLKIYSTFDLCTLLSGAELGSNTAVEVCSLGIPTLLLDASVNPYLYKGMAEFVKANGVCNATWIYQQPNMLDLELKLEELIENPDKRKELADRSQKLAHKRFGKQQLLKRIPLMATAAWSFFHKESASKEFHQLFRNQLNADLMEYQVSELS